MALIDVSRPVLVTIAVAAPVLAYGVRYLPDSRRVEPLTVLSAVVVLIGFCGLVAGLGGSGLVLTLLLGLAHPGVLSWTTAQVISAATAQRAPRPRVIKLPDESSAPAPKKHRRIRARRESTPAEEEPTKGSGLSVVFDGIRPAGRPDAADGEPPLTELKQPELIAITRLMSSADLVHAWQLSYLALERASSATDVSSVADLRRIYLDELEQRDPAGFAAWMLSGARAASNPARYVKPD